MELGLGKVEGIPIMARESPTLAMYSLCLRIILDSSFVFGGTFSSNIMTQVDPDRPAGIVVF